MIDLGHDTAVWIAKTFGLFYLMGFFVITAIHAYWPSKREGFEQAGRSILDGDDHPLSPGARQHPNDGGAP